MALPSGGPPASAAWDLLGISLCGMGITRRLRDLTLKECGFASVWLREGRGMLHRCHLLHLPCPVFLARLVCSSPTLLPFFLLLPLVKRMRLVLDPHNRRDFLVVKGDHKKHGRLPHIQEEENRMLDYFASKRNAPWLKMVALKLGFPVLLYRPFRSKQYKGN